MNPAEALGYWPLLLLPALFPLAKWTYRRNRRQAIRAAYQGRAGTTRQHGQERGDK